MWFAFKLWFFATLVFCVYRWSLAYYYRYSGAAKPARDAWSAVDQAWQEVESSRRAYVRRFIDANGREPSELEVWSDDDERAIMETNNTINELKRKNIL